MKVFGIGIDLSIRQKLIECIGYTHESYTTIFLKNGSRIHKDGEFGVLIARSTDIINESLAQATGR